MKKKSVKQPRKTCNNYQQNNYYCECEFCIEKKIERCENSTRSCLCYCGRCDP